MKLKRLLASLLSLMLIIPTACGDDEIISNEFENKTEITLSWWGNDTRNEYTLEAVLISDILFSDCLYRLTKQELSNSQIVLDPLAVADFVRNKNKSLASEIRTRFSKPDMAMGLLRPKQEG
jgi:hypothetical protein